MTPLEQRAFSAYFRSRDSAVQLQQPDGADTVVIEGKQYIVLIDANGILAVYRVRSVNGKDVLKRLKRYPKELQ